MITLKDWLEAIEYKITEGSVYEWDSYGETPYRLSRWDGQYNLDGPTSEVIFDTLDHTVYEVTVSDYKNERCYRWINPSNVEAYRSEAARKKVDPDEAYDNVKFINLELEEDILAKTKLIMSGQPYDSRVAVPLELEDDEIFQLMKMAHKYDVTLNQLVEKIIVDAIKRVKEN